MAVCPPHARTIEWQQLSQPGGSHSRVSTKFLPDNPDPKKRPRITKEKRCIRSTLVCITCIGIWLWRNNCNANYYYATENEKSTLPAPVYQHCDTNISDMVVSGRANLVCGDTASYSAEWVKLCEGNFISSADELLSQRCQVKGGGGSTRAHASQLKPRSVHMVQIGAHVGFEKNDPFAKGISAYLKLLTPEEKHQFQWTFVEPSPPNFERLQTNIAKHSNMCTMKGVNVGVVSDALDVDTTNGGMPFYSISESIDPETGYDSRSGKTFPRFITQVSSFSMKPIESNKFVWDRLGLQMEDYVVEEHVTTKRYSDLMRDILEGTHVEAPFFVLIDTEGFDCDIILGMGRDTPYLPKYLVFEDNQCGDKKPLADQYLKELGYEVTKMRSTQNTVAIRKMNNAAL